VAWFSRFWALFSLFRRSKTGVPNLVLRNTYILETFSGRVFTFFDPFFLHFWHFFTFQVTFSRFFSLLGGVTFWHFLTVFCHFWHFFDLRDEKLDFLSVWPPGWTTRLFLSFDSFCPLFWVKSAPQKWPPPLQKVDPWMCVYVYIYISWVKNHPPRFSYRGWNSLVFGVGFSDFGDPGSQFFWMPISDFWDADSWFRNATLFTQKKDTFYVEIFRASFSPQQLTCLCQCLLFFMPLLFLHFFSWRCLNAGLSPCSHTTTTTEFFWILTPGRVFKKKTN